MRYVIGMMFVASFTVGCGFEYDTDNGTTPSKKSKNVESLPAFNQEVGETTQSHPACGSGWKNWMVLRLSDSMEETNHTCHVGKPKTFRRELQFPISQLSNFKRMRLKNARVICFGYHGFTELRSNHESVGIKHSIHMTTVPTERVFSRWLNSKGSIYVNTLVHGTHLSVDAKLKSLLDKMVVKVNLNTTYTCDMSRGIDANPRDGKTETNSRVYIYFR